MPDAPPLPVEIGARAPGGGWATRAFAGADPQLSVSGLPEGGLRLVLEAPGAAAVSLAFAVPNAFQAFGGGERFDALDLHGQSVRYYLENFGLVGGGTYLPSPWIATTLGWGCSCPTRRRPCCMSPRRTIPTGWWCRSRVPGWSLNSTPAT